MKNNFDLIIFDWDGTLSNSAGLIINSIKEACATKGISIPSHQAISSVIGLELNKMFIQLFTDYNASDIDDLREIYTKIYRQNYNKIQLFEGVVLGINELKRQGYLLSIATGSSRRSLDRALLETSIKNCFSSTKTIDECFSKPHPQMILEILDSLMIEPERTLMVGDSGYDLQMAVNAKVSSLAVTYGSHVKDQLASYNALDYMDSPYEIFEWIGRYG